MQSESLHQGLSFRQSRSKLSFTFALTAMATLVLAFCGFVAAHFPGLWAYMGVSLFAPLSLALAVVAFKAGEALRRPSLLSTDENGIAFTSPRGTQFYRWQAIAGVLVFSPASRSRSPGIELKEAVNGRRFVSFGRHWEESAEEITEALKAAQDAALSG